MNMSRIRDRLYADASVGELARDCDDSLKTVPTQALVMTEVVYLPPFTVAIPAALGTAAPEIFSCLRARDSTAPTNVVTPTGTSWTRVGSAARIDNIGGLTSGTKYKLTFLVMAP